MDIDHLTTSPARAQAILEVLERIAASLELIAPALKTELDAKAVWRNDVNAKKAAREAKIAEKARLLTEARAASIEYRNARDEERAAAFMLVIESTITRVKRALKSNPGVITNQLHELVGAKRANLNAALDLLLGRGEIVMSRGPRNSKFWSMADAGIARPETTESAVVTPPPVKVDVPPPPPPEPPKPKPVQFSTPVEKIIRRLEEGPTKARVLYAASGIGADAALDALTDLQNGGVVRRDSETGLYSLVRPAFPVETTRNRD